MTIRLKGSLLSNFIGLIGAIAVISIFLTIASPYFLKGTNFINISNTIAINIIIAVGMTLVITSGGIDLSVGSNVALTGIIVATFYLKTGTQSVVGVIAGIIIGLLTGIMIGIINGTIINLLNVPPFIATLGTMGVMRGLALVVSNGRVLYSMPEGFEKTFAGFIGGVIPKPVIVAIVIAIIGGFILNRTTLGRYAKALGGNERCVRVAGIHIEKYKLIIYTIVGALSSISGLALTSMMNAAEPIAGNFYELDAIAVVVMGGTSLMGGRGTMLGTILGALLLGLVRNGLNIMKVPPNFHQLLVGIIILVAVVIGSTREMNR
jgi:ribose/xylose/arabinose/galactoside ABC-type transport system permease subunit